MNRIREMIYGKKALVRRSLWIGICLCAVWGWWGMLYPELTMVPSTYEIVYEDGAVQNDAEVVEWNSDNGIYWTILEADHSQLRFRSRLLKNINMLKD